MISFLSLNLKTVIRNKLKKSGIIRLILYQRYAYASAAPKPLKVPSLARSVPKPLRVRSVPKPLKVPSLARSVPKPLKVPSLSRSVPKPFKLIEIF